MHTGARLQKCTVAFPKKEALLHPARGDKQKTVTSTRSFRLRRATERSWRFSRWKPEMGACCIRMREARGGGGRRGGVLTNVHFEEAHNELTVALSARQHVNGPLYGAVSRTIKTILRSEQHNAHASCWMQRLEISLPYGGALPAGPSGCRSAPGEVRDERFQSRAPLCRPPGEAPEHLLLSHSSPTPALARGQSTVGLQRTRDVGQ